MFARLFATALRKLAAALCRTADAWSFSPPLATASISTPELTACSCGPKWMQDEKPATEPQSLSQVRAGYVLPVGHFEDELTLREALHQALRSHLPDDMPAKA